MTNENIERLIDALNKSEFNDRIFRSELSRNVDYAKVWINEPQGNIGNEDSCTFYFIKNESGIYVAAVYDMYNDLHVFVKEEHRLKGHLKSAMNEVILPKLCQDGRKKQRITFVDSNMADYVIKNWGFTVTNETSAEKDLSCYSDNQKIEAKNRNISPEEFTSIRKKIDRARLYIVMAQEQIESHYGVGNDAELGELAYDILCFGDKVLSYIEDKQGSLA